MAIKDGPTGDFYQNRAAKNTIFWVLYFIRIKKILYNFTHQNAIGFGIIALNDYFDILK